MKPNTAVDNIIYWIRRLLFDYPQVDVELPTSVFEMAHKLNMTVDQFVEKALQQHMRTLKHI